MPIAAIHRPRCRLFAVSTIVLLGAGLFFATPASADQYDAEIRYRQGRPNDRTSVGVEIHLGDRDHDRRKHRKRHRGYQDDDRRGDKYGRHRSRYDNDDDRRPMHHRDRYDHRHSSHHHPGHFKRVWVPPVYVTRYDPCGRRYRVCIRAGYYNRIWVQGYFCHLSH